MPRLLVFAFCLLTAFLAGAQGRIDVAHYLFHIEVSDRSDSIRATAMIQVRSLEDTDTLVFHLANNRDGRGMAVSHIYYGDEQDALPFSHSEDKLRIGKSLRKGDSCRVTIRYSGIPGDGLIISRNKYGKRTFFSDNWPDRAHHWIPCNDDPADKSAVSFSVVAPDHYQVISNGILIAQKHDAERKKIAWLWEETVPLPTKVMVIGVANFAIDTAGYVNDIPVTSWVFPENKKAGFYDYAATKDMLAWFIDYIGPYPYKKLANVQSKTIFGGMENAGAIFYNENSVDGKRGIESTLAHEVAHQWFGDMATEKSFSHLWLSEGFATYLSHMYLESRYGVARLEKELEDDRQTVIDFIRTSRLSVVDSTTPYMQLLNPNSYQKGGWILHMLRRQLGDTIFHRIIRSYYAAYAGKNADTRDFQKICEDVSGKKLEGFFDQWLYTAGIPELEVNWKYHPSTSKLEITVKQMQEKPFSFPLDILVQTSAGVKKHTITVTKKEQTFSLPAQTKPIQLALDPGVSLLFQGKVIPL